MIVRYPTDELFTAMRRGTEDPDTAPSAGLSMPHREAPLTGPAGGANIRADGRRAMIIKSRLRIGLVVALVAGMLAIAASSGRAEISGGDAQALSKADLIYIATVRKDGNQSKAAPVWFTITADNNSVLIQTGPETWKAKRIRRGSPALVWIGSANGPAFIGKAVITSDAATINKILTDFHNKYWENRIMGIGPSRARFASGACIAIRITPARDLPDGFTSAPGTPAPPLEAAQ
jgi:general stress protein 26